LNLPGTRGRKAIGPAAAEKEEGDGLLRGSFQVRLYVKTPLQRPWPRLKKEEKHRNIPKHKKEEGGPRAKLDETSPFNFLYTGNIRMNRKIGYKTYSLSLSL